jgi:hypothetical protein
MKYLLCVSYTQQFARKRNMINILVDQMPTLKAAQEEVEKQLGCYVENVVLANWSKVPDNYKL